MIRTQPSLPPGSATTNFANSKVGVVFDAGPGHDTVLGSRYADVFQGGEGNDSLSGKKGNDVLQGGAGLDDVTGGQGNDTFVFAKGDLLTSRATSNGFKGQVDKITDFQGAGTNGLAAQDVIRLEGFGAGTTLKYVAKDGGAQVYEVVDPTTAGRDGFISVSMANGSRAKLTANDYVVEPPPGARITNITEDANGSSVLSSISADGSTVVFSSEATNLVDGEVDLNDTVADIFVHDVATGDTVNVTLNGNFYSYGASLSADGSTLAFSSGAENLIEDQGDGNYGPDIFIYDVATGELVNLSLGIGYGGSSEPSLSADGSRVAFRLDGDGAGVQDIWVMDTATSVQEGGWGTKITEGGDGSSYSPSLSADGSTVAFHSSATNLIEGELDANGETEDIFVYDVATAETVNVTQGGNDRSYTASLSGDGSVVAFTSAATNLVDGEVDQNGSAADIFVYDMTMGEMVNITQGADGSSGGVSISADGSTVVFSSTATNLIEGETDANGSVEDIFVFDLATGEMTNLTQGRDENSFAPSISADGSTGTFSGADVDGLLNVFVWDLG